MTNRRDTDDLRKEVRDRFGPLPPQAEALLGEARLRQLAHRVKVRSISFQPPETRTASASSRFPVVIRTTDMPRLIAVLEATDQAYRVIDETTLHLRVRGADSDRISGEFLLSFLTGVFEKSMG